MPDARRVAEEEAFGHGGSGEHPDKNALFYLELLSESRKSAEWNGASHAAPGVVRFNTI
jgi:hypothetical protein